MRSTPILLFIFSPFIFRWIINGIFDAVVVKANGTNSAHTSKSEAYVNKSHFTPAKPRSVLRQKISNCTIRLHLAKLLGMLTPVFSNLTTTNSSAFWLNKPRLWYDVFVLWAIRVQASQAKTLHGIQSLARDCESPPHRIPSLNVWKSRWLLWLEDASTDESRRAAAALR